MLEITEFLASQKQ